MADSTLGLENESNLVNYWMMSEENGKSHAEGVELGVLSQTSIHLKLDPSSNRDRDTTQTTGSLSLIVFSTDTLLNRDPGSNLNLNIGLLSERPVTIRCIFLNV